jgi:hypothetical protein
MSTRGCVAVKTGKSWRGVYNHSDSYPQGLGAALHEYLLITDLKKFAKDLIRYDDWRDYLNGGVCKYCGGIGLGQPHSISGVIHESLNPGQDKYPDPERKYHKHEYSGVERNKIRANIVPKNAKYEALFIEWVYVVDPENRMIDILESVKGKGQHKNTSDDGKRTWMSDNYEWRKVKTVFIDDQIDWVKIEHET